MNNTAGQGSAIHSTNSQVRTTSCLYTNNNATDPFAGGALSVIAHFLYSDNCTFIANRGTLGGAIHVPDFQFSNTITATGSIVDVRRTTFIDNVADKGAAIYHTEEFIRLYVSGQFTNNIANEGILYIEATTVNFGGIKFTNNRGSIYLVNVNAFFNDNLLLIGNTGDNGGALTCMQSILTVVNASTQSRVTFNEANNGGGIFLRRCTLSLAGELLVSNNTAVNGAGIYSEQSVIECASKTLSGFVIIVEVRNNTSSLNGGGLHLISSDIEIGILCGFFVTLNTAGQNGGGSYLRQSSQITLHKDQPNRVDFDLLRLDFVNNKAIKGGGVYVVDNEEHCGGKDYGTSMCFMQTIDEYVNVFINPDANLDNASIVNVNFNNNTASDSGSDLYGGMLDRCALHSNAEILRFESNSTFTGLEYMLRITRFDWAEKTRPQGDIRRYISSDPVQLCFCSLNEIDCNYMHTTVHKKKGEPFSVRVVGIDLVGNPVPVTVITSFSSQTDISRLREGQNYQSIENRCTELKYNVFSTRDEANLVLHADGPCGDTGISKRDLHVSLLPCTCPIGFENTSSSIECICGCDNRLRPYGTQCSPDNETVQIDDNVWIEFTIANSSSDADGFVISDCPFDYCVTKPINLSFTTSQETDRQCAYNRTGVLCGECEEGLSLVFASSVCRPCSHFYLLLLIPFAVAGIALVVFILFLNMTVAEGTINGLILYANILAANRSIFLPFDSPNFLTVFISWLNLDFGIETCFYDGMDAYGKLLLQLAFPIYVFVLVGLIIVLSEKSTRFTRLISRRKPIATLCTLILLSYSKLLRITITSLQYSVLTYPDGSIETVWLSDGNIPYFALSHIPRFIIAFLIIILGGIFTVLLLCGQVFDQIFEYLDERKSKLAKRFTWVSHPKYTSFIREYHAPLSDKHRYWIGFLLLVRIVHILISSFVSEEVVVLVVGTLALGLIVFKLINKDWQLNHSLIYKNWPLDVLETLFLLNLTVLANATLFVQISRTNQQILAYISLAISFTTFIGIVLYHLYNLRWISKRITKIRKCFTDRGAPKEIQDNQQKSEQNSVYEPCDEAIVPPPTYTDDDNDREVIAETRVSYQPGPIIRRAVPDNQLRAGADWMDDLLPIQPEDYNVPAARPRPRQNEMTTFTEVDIRPHRQQIQ